MPSTRETLLGEAARCREAAEKTANPEVREGLLEVAQKYTELAGHGRPDGTLPALAREPRQPIEQQQGPQSDDDSD